MRELFDTGLNLDDEPMSQAALAAALSPPTCWLQPSPTGSTRRSLKEAGPKLKLIANFGAGVDNIDVRPRSQRGITVTNTPGVLTEDTADMTMALIMAVPRRLVEGAAR